MTRDWDANRYNGWANRSTWLVTHELGADGAAREHFRAAGRLPAHVLEPRLSDDVYGWMKRMPDGASVDWEEVDWGEVLTWCRGLTEE